MAAVAAPVLIDRADIHKSCKSLEGIVAVLAAYTEAAEALAAVQKKLAKALKETAAIKGTNHVPANALMNGAGVFEVLAEVDSKFAKIADREAENVGSELRKWFKKLAKEEKAHDERISNANAKIKQAGQAYEKKAKRKDRDAADEHSRYLTILNSVGPEMSQDKYNHSLMVTQRHTLTLSGCAASLARIAEAEWARACESVRRSAPSIGNVGEWRALCEAGWSSPVPKDLPDLGAPSEPERNKRSIDPTDKTHDVTRKLMPPPPAQFSDYSGSPTSPLTTRTSPSVARSSETNSAPDHSQQSHSRPPTPHVTSEPISDTLRRKFNNVDSETTLTPPPNGALESSEAYVTAASVVAEPLSLSPGKVISSLPSVDERNVPPDTGKTPYPDETITPESKLSHPQDLPPPFSSRESFLGDRGQTRSSEPVSDIQRDVKSNTRASPPSPIIAKTTRSAGGMALGRRVSLESTTSNGSLVAAMRDRYDTHSVKPASPPPRDLPRLPRKITELAMQYTPTDSPVSYRGLAADRFPTFQDRYPRPAYDKEREDRDREQYRSPAEAPAPERDYFAERDIQQYHAATAPTNRNRFLREDREKYQPRSPERFYADEMGVRGRPRSIDPVAEERALQEREEQLRERERQLEIERTFLASAREAGYASDTSGRSPHREYARRHESPEPILGSQSLRPPPGAPQNDHSPNCGCQRCSAQHYASSTPSLPRMVEKPDPPIQLRPEKPKSWLRRMSMPLVTQSSQSKSGGVSIASMALPEEDGRIMRRSFEMEREERSLRFGSTKQ